ncbi:MFS transporter [Altererythrobacter sp. MF3-039]|uniref:MFS transporter n=1 Tax=Altererythrobacter sp. MF3-039 TaxID=3252901 RepID=UPI00390C8EBB
MTEAAANTEKPWPSAGAGWFLVIMLTIAYIFSFVDRYILGLLVEPIKAEFELTDIEIGWLLSAFTIIYGFVGIFMGWLIDRGRRVWIVSIGIALWSAATVATGLAKNFVQLFIARMSVGVGEATLSPATFSMIGDAFPPEKRGKPIAFYSSALPVGAGIASLLSAGIIAWAASGGSQSLPFFGELSPWRFTLIVVGLPGIILALGFLFMKEPVRRPVPVSQDTVTGSGFGDALRYLWKNFALYAGVILVVCAMTAMAYSQGLLPSTFERTWGWSAQKYALINGIALLIIGPINMMIFGALSDRQSAKGIIDAPLKILYIGFFIMIPSGVIPYFMPSAELAYAVLCINTVGIGIVSAIGVTALLAITPSQIRGQIVALYYLGISWFGSLGPIVTGYLSNLVFGEENLRYAVAMVPIIFAILPLALMPMTRRLYREQLARLGVAKS